VQGGHFANPGASSDVRKIIWLTIEMERRRLECKVRDGVDTFFICKWAYKKNMHTLVRHVYPGFDFHRSSLNVDLGDRGSMWYFRMGEC
jgi:hypothetical protein